MAEAITQTVMPPPYIEDASRQLLGGLPSILNKPYQNYNELAAAGAVDPRLAGFAPEQLQAFDLVNQGVGSYQPYLDAATQTATNAPGAGMDLMQQSAQYGPLDQYLNPYTQNVVDTTMLEMNRQQQMQQDMLDAKAAQGGAFGGSRHGLAEVEMERAHDQNRNLIIADLMSKGYSAAQAAQEAHRQRQYQAGQGMGVLGLDTARTQADLGRLGQNLNLIDVGALGQVGGMQQGQLQKQYDINYNQWQDQQDDPYRRAGFMSDIIQGIPSSQSMMQSSMTPQKSPIAQGIGALGNFASMGQQFGWWGNSNNPSTTTGTK